MSVSSTLELRCGEKQPPRLRGHASEEMLHACLHSAKSIVEGATVSAGGYNWAFQNGEKKHEEMKRNEVHI